MEQTGSLNSSCSAFAELHGSWREGLGARLSEDDLEILKRFDV
jgi:hypothetical protein